MSEIPKKPRYRKMDADDLMFQTVVGKIPNGTYKKMRDISFIRDVPMSQLMAFAVEQEFMKAKPFDYKYDVSGQWKPSTS